MNEETAEKFLNLVPKLYNKKPNEQKNILKEENFSILELQDIKSSLKEEDKSKDNDKRETKEEQHTTYSPSSFYGNYGGDFSSFNGYNSTYNNYYQDDNEAEAYQLENLDNIYFGTSNTYEKETKIDELIDEIVSFKKIKKLIALSAPESCAVKKNPFKDLAKREIIEDEVIKSKKSEGVCI